MKQIRQANEVFVRCDYLEKHDSMNVESIHLLSTLVNEYDKRDYNLLIEVNELKQEKEMLTQDATYLERQRTKYRCWLTTTSIGWLVTLLILGL